MIRNELYDNEHEPSGSQTDCAAGESKSAEEMQAGFTLLGNG